MRDFEYGDITVVRTIITDEADENFLLLQRHDWHIRNSGKYELPGGQIKKGGNSFYDGAQEEVRNKTGLIVRISELTEVDRRNLSARDEQYPGGLYIAYGGVARIIGGEYTYNTREYKGDYWQPRGEPCHLNLTNQSFATIAMFNTYKLGM